MPQTAANLVDHVIPHVPVRQWVLSLPIPLRVLLAAQPELFASVPQVVQSVVTRHRLDGAGFKADEGQGGAVTLIQRFGSVANLNIHLHYLVLDGMYRCGADGAPSVIEAAAPSDDDLHALLLTVIARLMKILTRRGVLVEDRRGARCAAAGRDCHLQDRFRAPRRAKGADPEGCDAARGPGAPAAVRRHRRVQPACYGAGVILQSVEELELAAWCNAPSSTGPPPAAWPRVWRREG